MMRDEDEDEFREAKIAADVVIAFLGSRRAEELNLLAEFELEVYKAALATLKRFFV